MQSQVEIRPPQAEQFINHADLQLQLDQALELALEARSLDNAGDQAGANQLRKEYDHIFVEIWNRLDQGQ